MAIKNSRQWRNMTFFSKKIARQGFTLIELLVVISIIGILSAVLLVNFVGVRGRAGDAAKKNNVRQLKTALRLYYNDYQHYPAPASGGTIIVGCGASGTSNCPAGGQFSAGASPAAVYMNQIPTGITYYAPASAATGFLIKITLENASDADIVASQTKCAPTSRAYYTGGTPAATDYFQCED